VTKVSDLTRERREQYAELGAGIGQVLRRGFATLLARQVADLPEAEQDAAIDRFEKGRVEADETTGTISLIADGEVLLSAHVTELLEAARWTVVLTPDE
jgi:hypothetical protein